MRIHHIHFESINSTMDAARKEAPGFDFLLVTTDVQTQGRGTKGRPWMSPRGNVYLTLAVHRKFLPPARMKLFPLEVGVALWESVASCLLPDKRPFLHLKWPNDLLWEKRKTAGMLLESAGDHMLIGLGINIAEAPTVSDGGTPSACLAEAGMDLDSEALLAFKFSENLQTRLEKSEGDTVLNDWQNRALWNSPFRLRDRPGQSQVLPVDLNSDGHLCVEHEDGCREWLVSEYLA